MNSEVVNENMIIDTYDPSPNGHLSPQSLAELGAYMASAGFTTMEARALVALVQQTAAQAALNMAQALMEQIRRIQQSRFMELDQRVRAIAPTLGYIPKDRVLEILHHVATTPPRQ